MGGSPTTVKSLRPKKYGLKIPNYSTVNPAYQFYAPSTYAPPYNYKEVFKRKVDSSLTQSVKAATSTTDYDYEYYDEDDYDYIYSNNRRSDPQNQQIAGHQNRHHPQVQLVIAEHLHQEK